MLRLSDAASKLGIAPSTLRAFADRGLIAYSEMPNGERRFDESAVEAFRVAGASPPPARQREATPPAEPPRPRRPPWADVAPWERPALAAEAAIRVEKAKREIAQLAIDDAARAEAVERERIAARAAAAEQERKQREADQRERAEKLAEAVKPITEAISTFVARRKEQAEALADEYAQQAKASAARLAAIPEDRQLAAMEAAYLERKALLDVATLARRMRR